MKFDVRRYLVLVGVFWRKDFVFLSVVLRLNIHVYLVVFHLKVHPLGLDVTVTDQTL